jgi:hypothetical protein
MINLRSIRIFPQFFSPRLEDVSGKVCNKGTALAGRKRHDRDAGFMLNGSLTPYS